MANFVDSEAFLGSDDEREEQQDEYDGNGPVKEGAGTQGGMVDSSEEDEEEEEDEEAARAVQEGFIVDEDEEVDDRAQRRRAKRKRRREEREREGEHLDEEDLELIGEINPGLHPPVSTEQSKFKRLKRDHRERDHPQPSGGIGDMFNSDEEEEAAETGRQRRQSQDELDGFIEDDVFSDEELQRGREDVEVDRPARKGISGLGTAETAGLDENALEDMRAAFGDGNEYLFALDMEDQEQEQELDEEKQLDLKDVFEPSQLAEKMLTEEDNEIRLLDEPERHQVIRKPYRHIVLTDEQFREEAVWIANLMLLKKRVDPDLHEPFQRSVAKVLEFLVTEDWEVPFVFQHRKDYMIHAVKVPNDSNSDKADGPQYTVKAEKLLNMTDLWDIFDYDLKFKALIDKRNTIQKTYDNLQSVFSVNDATVEELISAAVTMEELQDVQDYIHFQYSSQLRDLTQENGEANGDTHRRKAPSRTSFDRVRKSEAYNFVRGFGITADAFAQNALRQGHRQYTEDPAETPEDLADKLIDEYYTSGFHVMKAATMTFAEELFMSPKLRKVLRHAYYMNGVIDCFRTEKGLRRIDEQHPYYEFKYLRNQQLSDIARRPELFLRMLKAEEEGLVEVQVRFENFENFRQRLYQDIESDNLSELADAWNRARRGVLGLALGRIERLMNRSVKENIRQECENHVARECREAFSQRLDQAPYKPKGMVLGTVPRVLALSTGSGPVGKEPIHWAYLEEDGRVLENGKFMDLSLGDKDRSIDDGKDVDAFVDVVNRRRPDVIGVSGFSPETRKLYKVLTELVDNKDLRGAPYTDDRDEEVSDALEVIIVNDEVARLYQNSDRAKKDHPGFAPLTHYCVALARYLQSPLKEYASLGRDVVSIHFKPSQQLVSPELLLRQLEAALVDMVNLVGVDINEATTDTATANLLTYVCGLGPRKAAHLLKIVNMNGGIVNNRIELLGVNAQYPAMGVKVWNNCASFLYIDFENADPDADPLDNTRVHPEDYDIARKMAADALELDEEDIKAETDENGQGAIVRKLFREEAQDRVNDLILEEYAEQLERNLNQRKRATLETIRAELQQPYEELRKQFVYLSTENVFTMLTGETSESLTEGMVVPVSLKRIADDHIDGKLDCGMDALVPEMEMTDRYDLPVRALYSLHQTLPAKILYLNRKGITCNVSLREAQVSKPQRKQREYMPGEWDERLEQQDREALQEKTQSGVRAMRVIKHPLFRPFNSMQAVEFLGTQSPGDAVIRPSSKGPDHLAVTWKVTDGVYQHIDVLELNKENEFSVGRTLKIGGKYTYSDLDDLIVNHVKAMAKKVDEMTLHEKYHGSNKTETQTWLETYTAANPKRSAYAFCIDAQHPGYFHLCFKAGENATLQSWPVKVIPQGFELQRNPYPDMRALCNGFKLLFTNMLAGRRSSASLLSPALSSRSTTSKLLIIRRLSAVMAGMEELEIHSKSYLVRWIHVKANHTISWSIQPHKKSLNFGIFKHPGHSAVLSSSLPASESNNGSSDLNESATGTRHASTNVIDKLTGIGLKPIKWVGKCEADRICQGAYNVPAHEEGNYALVFDNTFSKQTSKTATLVLLTYPTAVPPQSGYHGIRHQPGAAPAPAPTASTTSTSGADTARSASNLKVDDGAQRGRSRSLVGKGVLNNASNGNDTKAPLNSESHGHSPNAVHTGILQKRRRKRHQGWARRWFSLDFSSSTLSYYHDRNSSALRGAIPLSLAAVAANENSHEISVDSGAEIWHLRASNDQEFVSWKRALEKASKTPPAENEPQADGAHRIPSLQVVPDAVEQRDWSHIEELAGIVSESRDAVRRLAKDTDPKYLSRHTNSSSDRPRDRSPSPNRLSPSAVEANGDDYPDSRERRPFWRRKTSNNSHTSLRRSSASQQLTVPGQASDAASINGDRKPSSVSSHPDGSEDIHFRLMSLLYGLDHAVDELFTLIANRKDRRNSESGVLPQPRKSMESDVSQEFFDAHDGPGSPILTIQGDSDDESNTAKQAETVADDVPSDSSDDEESEPSPSDAVQQEISSSLFPTKPKSLTPLPLNTAVKRRTNITAPTVMPPSLIGFLRKNVGKDLSQISMPVSSNEPLSLLQRAAEIMEYPDVLDKATGCSDAVERLIYVTAFAISALSPNRVRERAIRKPFNPMLGETYELVREDLGFRFLAEKVSHRPVQLAYQAESKDWSLTQSPMPTQKFWGKSAEIVTEGVIRLTLHTTGEHFSWSAPTSFLRNIIAGEKYVEPAGELLVFNETTGQKTVSTFKAGGMFSGRSEDVTSKAFDSYGKELPLGINGTWSASLRLIKQGSLTNTTLWTAGKLVPDAPKHYGLTSFAATLNEVTAIEQGKLPATDSRLRPDQRALEDGDVDRAEAEKVKLEEKQRARRREMEDAGETWVPRWFTRAEDAATASGGTEVVWRLKSGKDGYWEERAKGSWTGVQPIFKL